ncbi:mycobactin polyketide synthase MbtD [Mycobacterium sp. pW049]|uniref:mycobactin polyketide synthase MbtD n=1 Tax=[Mycobacterium] bulgaricum TaxID=3238985 RepID=UPI00351B54D9
MWPVGLPDGRVTVPLSAHADELVAEDARAILAFLRRTPAAPGDIAAHIVATRRIRRHRAVVRAGDVDELAAALRAVADGREHPLVTRSTRRTTGRTAFVFAGQGSQWPSMGAESYQRLPAYRAEADRLDAAFRAAGLPSPLRFLTGPADPAAVSQFELQSAQFVHSVALAAVWRTYGVLPDLTIGHSLGEVAAAYVAATITLDDAVAVLVARSHAIASIPGDHSVAVLGLNPEQAGEVIAATDGWLELSGVNAGATVAVSGERTAVEAVVATVRARGQFARQLAMSFPAHTTAMETRRESFVAALPASVFADSPVQFIGSATGAVVAPGTRFETYWYANLRNTIRFDRAVQTAIRAHTDIYVEMSAHPSLLIAVEDGLERAGTGEGALLLGSGHRDRPITDTLAENIAAAAAADPTYRWADLLPHEAAPMRGFPGAPMRAEHLWAAPEPLPSVPAITVSAETWKPRSPGPRSRAKTVAVVEMNGAAELSAALRDAVTRHSGATAADADEAEVVIAVAPASEQSGVHATIEALARGIDDGLLDYAGSLGPRCRDVWLLTAGAEHVHEHDPVADLAQSALAAMHRSVGFEHPDQNFHHLDLPATGEAAGLTAAIDVMLYETGELALRGHGDLYRRVLGDGAPPAAPWPLHSGILDNVVITGGSGAIGLSYARYLAAHGARRIVLLSRRGVDPVLLDGLAAEIVAPACDISDPVQLAAAAADHADGEATLLVHAAGTARFANRADVIGADVTEMAAAKIAGLEALTELWPIRYDARILLCSSVTGVWGGKGVAAYAAVNRMLDVMAARLRAAGRNCIAMRWGLWEGSGIVDAAEIARVERAGLRQMNPEIAVETSLHDHPTDPLVLSADPDRLRMFFGVDEQRSAVDSSPADSDQRMEAPAAVRSQLAVVLNVDATELDLDSSLFDLGVDSLLALDLRKRLKRLTGRTVPLATLLGGITGTDLIADLSEKVDTSSD